MPRTREVSRPKRLIYANIANRLPRSWILLPIAIFPVLDRTFLNAIQHKILQKEGTVLMTGWATGSTITCNEIANKWVSENGIPEFYSHNIRKLPAVFFGGEMRVEEVS